MPGLETPRPAGVRARARLTVLWAVAAAAMLLALVRSAPASAQGRPLQLFTRGTGQDSAAKPLPAGTRLRVFAEPRRGAQGKNAQLRDVPPRGTSVPRTDSITEVRDGFGRTATTYADSLRYLIVARTREEIFWSVDPRNPATPRYHSLDSLPRIRMAVVPQPNRAALDSLFPAASTGHGPPGPGFPTPPKKGMVVLSGWEMAGLLLLAAVVGLVGGWIVRNQVSRVRRIAASKARAEQSRGLRSQSSGWTEFGEDQMGGGLENEGWVLPPEKAEKPEKEALDEVLEVRLTELESRICEHVTDQIKYARGDILGHLESSGIQPAGGTRLGIARPNRLGELPASTGGDNGPAARAAEVFLWWCQNAGGTIGKLRDFSESIRDRLADSEVQMLARDRDSNAVTFVSGGAGDPVEYWLVSVKGEHLLFPRPLNQKRFMELYPVYNGDAGPQSLGSIEPASVRQDGGRWVLAAQGRVG